MAQTYFISYTTRTSNDEAWAKWTDWVLKNKLGVETIMQEYDFHPGDNFKERMHDALMRADAVVCILSHTYQMSANCTDEWTNAEKIIPIRFDDCKPRGLLKSRVYIDLYGMSKEAARRKLIEKLTGTKRPNEEPEAPFATVNTEAEPPFPAPPATDYNMPSPAYNELKEEELGVGSKGNNMIITGKKAVVVSKFEELRKEIFQRHKIKNYVIGFLITLAVIGIGVLLAVVAKPTLLWIIIIGFIAVGITAIGYVFDIKGQEKSANIIAKWVFPLFAFLAALIVSSLLSMNPSGGETAGTPPPSQISSPNDTISEGETGFDETTDENNDEDSDDSQDDDGGDDDTQPDPPEDEDQQPLSGETGTTPPEQVRTGEPQPDETVTEFDNEENQVPLGETPTESIIIQVGDVSFDPSGGIQLPSSGGDAETEFPIVINPGHVFIGWYLDGSPVSSMEEARAVAKNSTLKAIWEISFTIYFDLSFGELSSRRRSAQELTSIDIDELGFPPIKYPKGYTLKGWYFEETLVSSPKDAYWLARELDFDEAEITIVAKWQENWITGGSQGEAGGSQREAVNSQGAFKYDEKSGEWVWDDLEVPLSSFPWLDILLIFDAGDGGLLTGTSYQISIDYIDDIFADQQDYDPYFDFPSCVKPGYTFTGWFLDGDTTKHIMDMGELWKILFDSYFYGCDCDCNCYSNYGCNCDCDWCLCHVSSEIRLVALYEPNVQFRFVWNRGADWNDQLVTSSTIFYDSNHVLTDEELIPELTDTASLHDDALTQPGYKRIAWTGDRQWSPVSLVYYAEDSLGSHLSQGMTVKEVYDNERFIKVIQEDYVIIYVFAYWVSER